MKMDFLRRLSISVVALIFFGLVWGIVNPSTIRAEDKTTVRVEGYLDYDKAFEVLDLLNEHRKDAGLGELVMDKKLLESAMTRAVETSVYFDHYRPDGSLYYAIDGYIYGENIAAGRNSASGTFDQWWNSPSHKDIMMKASYTCIGIGVAKVNGVYYWSQEFGYTVRNTTKSGVNKKVVKPIVVNISSLSTYSLQDDKLNLKTGTWMELEIYNQNRGFEFASVKLLPDYIRWSSDNDDIVKVNDEGIIMCLSQGTTTVNAYYRGTNIVICRWSITTTGKSVSAASVLERMRPRESAIKGLKVMKNRRIKVKLKKVSGVDGYQIQIATNKSMKKSSKIKTQKTTLKLSKFKKGKKVYIRVRTYKKLSDGGIKYSVWSLKKKVRV